jgi:hypothetical protein
MLCAVSNDPKVVLFAEEDLQQPQRPITTLNNQTCNFPPTH